MSWGPGSPLGWAGFLVGRGMAWGWCWWGERRGRAERDQPSPDKGRRQGCASEENMKLSLSEPAQPWGVPAGLGPLYFLRGHREGPQHSARTLNGLIIC